ncbi:serine/threonine-protein phosphatase 6 regulatory ankyrin repeat subunit A-like, partial [Thraustotheca clavata]
MNSHRLHEAALHGNISRLRTLISEGTKVDGTLKKDETPIYIAAHNGHDDINGVSPLFIAAQNGDVNIVSQLISAGANINLAERNGYTPLYTAAEQGYIDIVEILVSKSPDIDIRAQNGLTSLMIALKNQLMMIVDLLKNEKVKRLKLLVISAVQSGDTEKLHPLLSEIENPNIVDQDGNYLLHLAIKNIQPAVLKNLVKLSSINLNFCNKIGGTPLTHCIKSDNLELIDTMFELVPPANKQVESIDLIIESPLGSSGCAVVYKGEYLNKSVAVKTLITNKSPDTFFREVETMEKCRSPYVLRLIGVCDFNSTSPKLVLEFMDGGDSRSYLNRKKNKLPTLTNYSTLEIAWVIANVRCDFYVTMYACFMMMCRKKSQRVTRKIHTTMTQDTGTLYWTAPEVLKGRHY